MQPYLTQDSARRCECEPVLADSLLFGWRQITGSKIESCNSGIIQLTKRQIIASLAKTRFNVEHFLLNSLFVSIFLSLLPVCPSCLSAPSLCSTSFSYPCSPSLPSPVFLPLHSFAHLSAPSLLPSLMFYPFILSYFLLISPSLPLSPSFYSC